jgi:hypothetical protein
MINMIYYSGQGGEGHVLEAIFQRVTEVKLEWQVSIVKG